MNHQKEALHLVSTIETDLQLTLDGRGLELVPSQSRQIAPFKTQLLKWIGSKQRFAHEIVSYFPSTFRTYIEPFVGSGAVLGTLAPQNALASDTLKPLIEIWETLAEKPQEVKQWYLQRWESFTSGDPIQVFEKIKAAYNSNPNGADLLFLSRSCYGGVIRFRQQDGYISTPCGVHKPMHPQSFYKRVDLWHARIKGTIFSHRDFESAMGSAKPGDMVYCDPPYAHSQTILYGAQEFDLQRLLNAIALCKERGVYVALSIDGTKRSGQLLCKVTIPPDLFEREVIVNCGQSMLRRFQMSGETLENEVISDRLLLTY
ncbi:MAG TPA: Dam family site-specific DNA-(adenine-N6)-methyltransferase [Candidatus Saccharimonadales bacterium]|nr:Dam family site-specific DNA-(adenine-N6)-methyltransferase [Candidatus Saccharimonadales bacterium]